MRFRVIVSACVVVLLGGGWALAQSTDLSDGVFIVHAPSGLQYTNSPPTGGWCGAYAECAIDSCSEQINRIDSQAPVVWYVLAAWTESKQWCGTEFGLGNYDADNFAIWEHGACFPSTGMSIPTSGWPGPNEGIALTTTDVSWSGNFIPVYWFAGYAYGEDVIPLAADPGTGLVGWARCNDHVEVPAGALGGMGLFTEGISACPECEPVEGTLTEDENVTVDIQEIEDGYWVNLGGGETTVTVTESSDSLTVLDVTIGGFYARPLAIDAATYYDISLQGAVPLEIRGLPALPQIRRSLVIADDQRMVARVTDGTYVEVPAMPVVPSRGSLGLYGELDSLSYRFDPIYDSDCWWPTSLAEAGTPYILRDFRGSDIGITPFQYSPGRKALRVFTHLEIAIAATGADTVNVIERAALPDSLDRQFAQLYENHFLNYNDYTSQRVDYDPILEDGPLLIVIPNNEAFERAMDELVNWKLQRGQRTEVFRLSSIAPTAEEVCSVVRARYGSDHIAYVLLVGDLDVSDPTMFMPSVPVPAHGGDLNAGFADAVYAHTGCPCEHLDDAELRYIPWNPYPSMFVGRFSAQDPGSLTTQARRSVEYERDLGRDPEADYTWLGRAQALASNFNFGNPFYDPEDGQRHTNAEWMECTAARLHDAGGYEVTTFIHDTEGLSALEKTAMRDGISAGCGLILYSQHGEPFGWAQQFTDFKIAQVDALTNSDELPLVISHACDVGRFSEERCFAEAWLWHTSAGRPAGAIATFMSATFVGTPGPQCAEREMVRLLSSGEMCTVGGVLYNGVCYMVAYNESSRVDGLRWTIFGDPSLMVRTKAPETMTVTHDGVIYPSQSTYEVHVSGTDGAMCALYACGTPYGTLYGSAEVSDGEASITVPSTVSWPTELLLTVTARDKVTYQGVVHPACVVEADQSGDYETIGDAVQAAIDGTVIELGDGTFQGVGNRDIACDKSITVRSVSREAGSCVVDCGGSQNDPHRWLYSDAEESRELRLEGIAIQNGWISEHGGAVSWSGPVTINDCMFSGNEATNGAALYLSSVGTGESCTIEGCTIYGNTASAGGAVCVDGDLTIKSCTISNNASTAAGALVLGESCTASIEQTIIAFDSEGSAVHIETGASASLSCSDLHGNDGGDWVGSLASQLSQNDNMCADPRFCDLEDSVYYLCAGSPCSPGIPPCSELLTGAWPVSDCCDPSVAAEPSQPQTALALAVGAPSRLNSEMRIDYVLPRNRVDQRIQLSIQDPTGRTVRRLVDESQTSGAYRVVWDGLGEAGERAPAGVYFCNLTADGKHVTRRIVLIK
jgi:gingipain R